MPKQPLVFAPTGECGRPMRGGGHCHMNIDHRGRCSTVVYSCDVCKAVRRGHPHICNDYVSACFMCARQIEVKGRITFIGCAFPRKG